MKKKIISALLALALVLPLTATVGAVASTPAQAGVGTQILVKALVKGTMKVIKAAVTEDLRRASDGAQVVFGEEGKDTTYVIDEWTMPDKATGEENWNPVFMFGIVIKGNVTIAVKDGVKCTIGQFYKNKDQGKNSPADAGITVSGEGNSLTITSCNSSATAITEEDVKNLEDPKGTGHLIVYGGYDSAAIGGESDVNGQKGENITIEDCYIDAYGGDNGAGIGGGSRGTTENIIINGGHIYAVGGGDGAGIGSGYRAGNEGYDNEHTWYHEDDEVGGGNRIYINGGTVEAYGGLNAAGIGGGTWSDGHNIVITGGKVSAYGNNGGAGIGAGRVTWSNEKCFAYNILSPAERYMQTGAKGQQVSKVRILVIYLDIRKPGVS